MGVILAETVRARRVRHEAGVCAILRDALFDDDRAPRLPRLTHAGLVATPVSPPGVRHIAPAGAFDTDEIAAAAAGGVIHA